MTADLYVRAHSPVPDRLRSIVEALETLADDGELADYSVHRIPPEVDLDEGAVVGLDHERALFDVLDSLADRDDYRGYPFRRVSRRSTITGETNTVVLLPALCLLLYDGSELIDVAPHYGPERTWHVEDSLGLVANAADLSAVSPPTVASDRDQPEPERGSGARVGSVGAPARFREGGE